AGNAAIGISTGLNTRFETTGGQNLFAVYNTFASTSGTGLLVGMRNWVLNTSNYGTTSMTGVSNDFDQNTSNSSVVGVENNFTGTGGGIRYGIKNNYTGSGSTFYGFYNWIDNGSSTQYGSYSNFSSTGGGTKYGDYIYMAPSAGGTHYGLYLDVTKAGSYAAYIKGRVAIGSTSSNQYILPESRGTANQVMQTDVNGIVTWVNPSAVFSETDPKVGTLTANYIPKWGTSTLQNGSIFDNGKVGIGTSSPSARFQVLDSAIVFNASGDTSSITFNNPPPVQGQGRRMLWYPERAAFRVGCVEFTDSLAWNRDSIGVYSMALGYNTKAKGYASTAFGWQSKATGNYATVSGYSCLASGESSSAMGYSNTASSDGATALGVYCTASGYRSVAMGSQNIASGSQSVASGGSTVASGNYSLATNILSAASGDYSTAGGYNSKSKGSISMAIGNNTISNGYSSFAIGQWNDSIVSAQTSMNANTPLFIIGNGTSNTVRSNVMVARNNGRVGIGVNAPGGQFELGLDEGRKPGTNTWTIVSDARLKQIHGSYAKGLNEIVQLQPIRYHYQNTENRQFPLAVLNQEQIGFSAQDVQKIFPECVQTDEDGYLSLNTHAILIAYVNAIKELHAQQEAQELAAKKQSDELQQLKADYLKLLERIESLEKK
ncbi:MAG: tail fiber domain-containing protein, partial [Chitinophagaceae bacterium]|nr:tail fiber domain-containing protein [Chitinophagaceae bacterium]